MWTLNGSKLIVVLMIIFILNYSHFSLAVDDDAPCPFEHDETEEGSNGRLLNDLAKDFIVPKHGRNLGQTTTKCYYNLKKLANRVLKGNVAYDIIRDPSGESATDDQGFPRYILPRNLPFNGTTCSAPHTTRALTFYVPLAPNSTHYGASCMASQAGSIFWNAISAFDCNGRRLGCNEISTLQLKNGPSPQGILLVITPTTSRVPKGYRFWFAKRNIPKFWCDVYPFEY